MTARRSDPTAGSRRRGADATRASGSCAATSATAGSPTSRTPRPAPGTRCAGPGCHQTTRCRRSPTPACRTCWPRRGAAAWRPAPTPSCCRCCWSCSPVTSRSTGGPPSSDPSVAARPGPGRPPRPPPPHATVHPNPWPLPTWFRWTQTDTPTRSRTRSTPNADAAASRPCRSRHHRHPGSGRPPGAAARWSFPRRTRLPRALQPSHPYHHRRRIDSVPNNGALDVPRLSFLAGQAIDRETAAGWQRWRLTRHSFVPAPRVELADYKRLSPRERGLHDLHRAVSHANLPFQETPMSAAVGQVMSSRIQVNALKHKPTTRAGLLINGGGYQGKTETACEVAAAFEDQWLELHGQRNQDAPAGTRDLVATVAYVQTPVTPTPKMICEAILDFYGADHKNMTLGQLIRTVRGSLHDHGTRVLLLDDITRLKLHREADQDALDLLRSLMSMSVTLVLIGVGIPSSGLLREGRHGACQPLWDTSAGKLLRRLLCVDGLVDPYLLG